MPTANRSVSRPFNGELQFSPELGLVCITTSPAVRFKTLTRKRLLQLSPAQQEETLQALYAENLKRLQGALDFCEAQDIRLYRLVSNLFPFADTPQGAAVLEPLSPGLRQIGERAKALGIRLVLHPNQFVVLNSDTPTVIENSLTILATEAHLLDLLGLPQSSWAAINIHGGKGNRAERLVQVIRQLPDSIRCRLTLENDEYTYGSAEIFEVCRAAGVPWVFDAHHHLVHDKLESYDDPSIGKLLAAARTTWPQPDWQMVHISNGREFLHDPRHSDFIEQMPQAFRHAPWIEVEAKRKEDAIARCRELPLFAA